MSNTNYGGQRRAQKDLGFGYKKSYKDKKTGQPVNYLKISLRPEILGDLTAGSNGLIDLVIFSNTGPKKSAKSPDVTVKPATVSAKGANAGTTAPQSSGNASDFPF